MTPDACSAYRRTAGHSAGPVRLVIMLYEQIIKDLQRALAALEKKNIEARTSELSHALAVAGQLQGTLDKQQGGEVAEQLDRFYWQLRAALLEAQVRVSPELLRQQIAGLLELREAWIQVERSRQENTEPASPTSQPVSQSSGEKGLRWSV